MDHSLTVAWVQGSLLPSAPPVGELATLGWEGGAAIFALRADVTDVRVNVNMVVMC